MTGPLDFTVHGTPAPQGSKRHVGGGRMVESSKALKPWREAVKHAALDALAVTPFLAAGPVVVTATFYVARPKGHYRTGTNAHLLRDSAPRLPTTKPDLDKVLRGCLDAMTDAAVWFDDAQVAMVTALKVYADPQAGQHVGATVRVEAL